MAAFTGVRSGEYGSPLERPTFVEVPLVAGYATARLLVALQFQGTGTTPALNDNLVLGLFENTGATTATIQLQQTGDYVSGPRQALGNAFQVVPGGRSTQTFTPQQRFVEVWTNAGGPTTARIQLQSQLAWNWLGFDKLDAVYPPKLWQPAAYGQPTAIDGPSSTVFNS